MAGIYTQGEDRWALEFGSLAAARRHLLSVGAKFGGCRTPSHELPDRRGIRVAEYDVFCDTTGYQGADILIEYNSGRAVVYGSL